jgi:serine protease
MRRSILAAAVLAAAACSDLQKTTAPAIDAALAPAATGVQALDDVMPGEVVVRVRAGASVADVAARYGLTVDQRGYGDAFVVMLGAVGNERALAARVGADAAVAYAEPNLLREPTAIDPRLWAFYNPGGLSITFTRGQNRGSVVGSYLSTLDADEDNVEGYAAGGAPVVIGSIDTGVEFSHPEFLPGQLIPGRDWYGKGDDDPSDENDHGTHTTGTMVGRTVGIGGVSGAGGNVRVYVQRVCGRRGCPSAAIASAIRAAADYPGMVAMNLSLGGASLSQAEADAITYATGKNVLVIASAGNGGTGTVECPACDPRAISVAASNWKDALSYYSSFGPGLDLTASGGEMYSNTSPESGIYSSVRGGAYAYFQGTSMAAPQVTGTAGIVASKTGLTGAALRARLESSADDLGTAGYDTSFGNGRLNSYRAVTGVSLGAGL